MSALDYLYEVLFENHESENFDEVLKEEIYKVIHDSSLIEKHDCNDVTINSINVNYANDMQSHKLGDAMFDEDDFFVPQVLMSKFIMMIACSCIMKRMIYVIVILLNSFMMLLKFIMR